MRRRMSKVVLLALMLFTVVAPILLYKQQQQQEEEEEETDTDPYASSQLQLSVASSAGRRTSEDVSSLSSSIRSGNGETGQLNLLPQEESIHTLKKDPARILYYSTNSHLTTTSTQELPSSSTEHITRVLSAAVVDDDGVDSKNDNPIKQVTTDNALDTKDKSSLSADQDTSNQDAAKLVTTLPISIL